MTMRAQEAHDDLEMSIAHSMRVHLASLDAEAGALLIAEQRAWEQWSKARAQLISDTYRGGSHRGLAYSYEMIDLYEERINRLHALDQDLAP